MRAPESNLEQTQKCLLHKVEVCAHLTVKRMLLWLRRRIGGEERQRPVHPLMVMIGGLVIVYATGVCLVVFLR